LKKAWLASITLLFTVSVLVFSSQAAYAGQNQQTPEFAIKCYQFTSSNPVINPSSTLFQDQFQTNNVVPDVDNRYCVEALKHSDQAPLTARYWVQHEDESCVGCLNPNGVTITDQFLGTFTDNLFHNTVLVPAAVSSAVLVPGPVNNQVYSGYSTTGIMPPQNAIMVTDQFGTSMITLDMGLFSFEASAIVGPQGSLIGQDLTCYMFQTEVPPINPTAAQSASTWVTQFVPGGASVTDLDLADILCVKATKMEPIPPTPPTVGGEFLPIETTSLLLAAASSPASWLTSLTIAALGIGVYVFTRNPNNMRNIKIILRDYLDRF